MTKLSSFIKAAAVFTRLLFALMDSRHVDVFLLKDVEIVTIENIPTIAELIEIDLELKTANIDVVHVVELVDKGLDSLVVCLGGS